MKISYAFLGLLLLATLAPSAGWADPPAGGTASGNVTSGGDDRSGGHDDKGAQHGDKNGQSDTKAREHANNSDRHDNKGDQHDAKDDRYTIDLSRAKSHAASREAQHRAARSSTKEHHRAAPAGTGPGVRGLARAGLTSRLTPKGPTIGLPVWGNAVARHTAVQPSMGGPITFDPKKHELVIIGGTAMARAMARNPVLLRGDHQ